MNEERFNRKSDIMSNTSQFSSGTCHGDILIILRLLRTINPLSLKTFLSSFAESETQVIFYNFEEMFQWMKGEF